VIAITLNFKSIEAARQALLEIPSSSLVEAADAPKSAQAPAPAASTTAKAGAASKKTAAEPAPTAASAEAAHQAPTAATAPQETAADPKSVTTSLPKPSESVEYPVLQKAVFALAGKSREAAAAVAASMGVKTFKELDQSKWAEALAAVTHKLTELEAA
jgi:hypothetical protein